MAGAPIHHSRADRVWLHRVRANKAFPDQIFREICFWFSEYASRAVDICSSSYSGDHRAYGHDKVIPRLEEAIAEYGLPLIRLVIATEDDEARYRRRRSTIVWTLDPCAARIYLSRHLSSEPIGHFDFLALPPELRTTIYEHVMSYTKMTVQRRRGGFCFFAEKRASESSDCAQYDPFHDRVLGLHLPTVDQMLSLVRVNKQIYREAMPVFFSSNSFWCGSLAELAGFVGMLRKSDSLHAPNRSSICASEPSRIESLRDVGFRLDTNCRDGSNGMRMAGVVEELLRVRRLERLTVAVGDRDWYPLPDYYSPCPETLDVQHMKPVTDKLIDVLLKAEQYRIEGDFGRMQQYLEEMVKLDAVDECEDDAERMDDSPEWREDRDAVVAVVNRQPQVPVWELY